MHDAGGVGLGQPVGHLRGDVQRPARRQARPGQQLAQRLAFDQLHADVGLIAGLAQLVDGDDGGMVQRRGGAGFLFEAAQPIGIVREIGRQQLECDVALQRQVAGPVDLAHAARAQERSDFIVPEPCPRRQSHPAELLTSCPLAAQMSS